LLRETGLSFPLLDFFGGSTNPTIPFPFPAKIELGYVESPLSPFPLSNRKTAPFLSPFFFVSIWSMDSLPLVKREDGFFSSLYFFQTFRVALLEKGSTSLPSLSLSKKKIGFFPPIRNPF